MAEDSFFHQFLVAISKLGSMSLSSDEVFKDIYLPFWHEFDGKSMEMSSFAVVDGSGSSSTFRGGVRVAVVRAIANVYRCNGLVGSVYDVDVRVGHRLRRASLYMRALEFKCLKKALEDYEGVSMALCDGGLYPTIHPLLVRLTAQEVEAYLEYLKAFSELYRFAMDRKILLIGITKDSFINYLGAQILAYHILQENPDLGRVLSRVRSIKKIMRILSSLKDRLNKYSVYFNEAQRMSMSSDEEIFDEYATNPGFTVPLVLAPQPIYLSEEVKAGTRRWKDSKIRDRLMNAEPPLNEVALTLDKLYELPPVVLSYWRPWHGLGVYRVDVAGWAFGLDIRWDSLEGDYFLSNESVKKFKDVVAVLNGLSPEPFTVKPLLDADDLVRFSANTYKECYEPLIIGALRKAGLKALLTKHDLRELMVRI